MQLRHIERGALLKIKAKGEQGENIVYEAMFYDMNDPIYESTFVVQCSKLNRNYKKHGKDERMDISFNVGPSAYAFSGRLGGKTYSDLVVIEKTSAIEEINQRKDQRDDIRVEVRIYGLPKDMLEERMYDRPEVPPSLVDLSFDISNGGMSVVSDINLTSEHDPYYLLDFSFNRKDSFILPAMLVRRSDDARSKVGKYDYGLRFLFDSMPNERNRLANAILSKKLL